MRTPILINEVERHLREIESLKKGFDLLSDHVVITDPDGNIIYANKAVETNTGFSVSETLGKNPGDLWGGHMPKEFYEKMWHNIKTKKLPFIGEVQNRKKDGTPYWQEIHICPALDERGNIKFFIGIEPNITERKSRDQFRMEFISAVAHQLRNPLTGIKWILEGLLSRNSLPEAERNELTMAYEQNQTLADLVSDLLMLARMEKGTLKSETVLLEDELRECLATVKKKEPNVSFVFSNETGPLHLNMIRALALQVFLNLIYNAAEHGEKGHGQVAVTLQKSGEGIRFACHNNGAPMPATIKSHLFSKVAGSGEGLGLFIVKMICDYLGWQVGTETVDNGTTFFVKIPTQA